MEQEDKKCLEDIGKAASYIQDTLLQYLTMELRVIMLDSTGRSSEADLLRDQMTPVWHLLTDRQHDWLNGRKLDSGILRNQPVGPDEENNEKT
jgi:hypothetical protein